MLELNKKENGNVNYIILILVLYGIISIGVTFYLISVKNNKNDILSDVEIEENQTNEINYDYSKIKRVSLTDKYYINNIKIENKDEYSGGIINYNGDTPQYKVSIRYPEISGLKNKKIEEKINTEIKNYVEELKDNSEMIDPEIENIYISADIMANFSNVLSISFYKVNFLKDNNIDSRYLGLNFRLDTGEILEFKDLFTEDASMKSIISQSAYKYLAFEYATEAEEFDMFKDMNEFDYSKVENNVYKLMNAYNQNPDIEFYFNESKIYVYIQEKIISIDMINFDRYINIYNLVEPRESLYSDGNRKKVNYIFGMAIFENYEYFDKISNNIFLGIYNGYKDAENTTYNETYTEYMKNYNEYKDKIIDAIKDYEMENEKSSIYNIDYIDVNDEAEYKQLRVFAEKIEVDDLDKEIDEVYAKGSRGNAMDLISFYELHNEYRVYNVQINEDINGELNVTQEEILSDEDV